MEMARQEKRLRALSRALVAKALVALWFGMITQLPNSVQLFCCMWFTNSILISTLATPSDESGREAQRVNINALYCIE